MSQFIIWPRSHCYSITTRYSADRFPSPFVSRIGVHSVLNRNQLAISTPRNLGCRTDYLYIGWKLNFSLGFRNRAFERRRCFSYKSLGPSITAEQGQESHPKNQPRFNQFAPKNPPSDQNLRRIRLYFQTQFQSNPERITPELPCHNQIGVSKTFVCAEYHFNSSEK